MDGPALFHRHIFLSTRVQPKRTILSGLSLRAIRPVPKIYISRADDCTRFLSNANNEDKQRRRFSYYSVVIGRPALTVLTGKPKLYIDGLFKGF